MEIWRTQCTQYHKHSNTKSPAMIRQAALAATQVTLPQGTPITSQQTRYDRLGKSLPICSSTQPRLQLGKPPHFLTLNLDIINQALHCRLFHTKFFMPIHILHSYLSSVCDLFHFESEYASGLLVPLNCMG